MKNRWGKTEILVLALALLGAIMFLYLYHSVPAARIAVLAFLYYLLLIGSWALYRFVGKSSPSFVYKVLFPVALVVGSFTFALFFPPESVPDEGYHFWCSYRYSNVVAGVDGLQIRLEDQPLFTSAVTQDGGSSLAENAITAESWESVKQHMLGGSVASGWISLTDVPSVNPGAEDPFPLDANLPQQKIPSILGILLAKALNLEAVWLFLLGRLFNAFYGCVLIYLAVRITPVGRNVFMATALLPMTLHLLGSYSYDVGIIWLGFLLTALLLSAIFGEGKMGKGHIAAIVVVGALLAPCKVVYAPLLLLLFCIPKERFRNRRAFYGFLAIVFILAILSIGLFKLPSLLSISGVDATTGSERVSEWTLSEIVSQPGASFMVLVRTFIQLSDFYLASLVGGSLGWFQANIAAPNCLTFALLGLLIIASFVSKDDSAELSTSIRVLGLVAFLITSMGILLSMWLGWYSSDTIQGVQGRYFLPALPLLLLSLRSRFIHVDCNTGYALVLIETACFPIYLAYIAVCVFL